MLMDSSGQQMSVPNWKKIGEKVRQVERGYDEPLDTCSVLISWSWVWDFTVVVIS